jgi:hypothetical protein
MGCGERRGREGSSSVTENARALHARRERRGRRCGASVAAGPGSGVTHPDVNVCVRACACVCACARVRVAGSGQRQLTVLQQELSDKSAEVTTRPCTLHHPALALRRCLCPCARARCAGSAELPQ